MTSESLQSLYIRSSYGVCAVLCCGHLMQSGAVMVTTHTTLCTCDNHRWHSYSQLEKIVADFVGLLVQTAVCIP